MAAAIATGSAHPGQPRQPVASPQATSTNGRICPPASSRVKGTIVAGAPIPSVAFFESPRHTSALRAYIRQEARSVASKMSVRSPARR